MNKFQREVERLRQNIREARAAGGPKAKKQRTAPPLKPKKKKKKKKKKSNLATPNRKRDKRRKAPRSPAERMAAAAKAGQSYGRSKSRLGMRGGAVQRTGGPRNRPDRRFKTGGR
jgi:hypothetical protein